MLDTTIITKTKNHTKLYIMKKLTILFALLFGMTAVGMAQGAMIKGQIFDAISGETLPTATVYVKYADQMIGTTTDMDGRFTLKPLPSGTYNLTVTFIGYKSRVIEGVLVKKDKITTMGHMALNEDPEMLGEFEIVAYKVKLIDPEDPMAMTMLAAELQATPSAKSPVDAVNMMSSAIQKNEETGQLYFRGARPESMGYYTDGVKQQDQLRGVPGSSIGQMTVYVGGIPAKYGDLTGGVVVIETKSYFDLYNQWLVTESRRDRKAKALAASEAADAPVEQIIEE
jgi:hypothetical protein